MQNGDQVDDAVAGAILALRLLEPGGKHSVFGHPVQHAVGAHDGSILRARQDQHSYQHHEAVKQQFQRCGADEVHGDAADQVGKVLRPHLVGDDHHRKKRHQRGEQQAVNKNHQPGFFQILELRVLDLAVDLGQSLLPAHGENGMSEADEQNDPGEMADPGAMQPTHGFLGQRDDSRVQRIWGQLYGRVQNRNRAPDDQQDDHDGRDDHDLQRLLAGFVKPLDVLPPEVQNDKHGKCGGEMIFGEVDYRMVQVSGDVFHKAGEILAGGNRADGSG